MRSNTNFSRSKYKNANYLFKFLTKNKSASYRFKSLIVDKKRYFTVFKFLSILLAWFSWKVNGLELDPQFWAAGWLKRKDHTKSRLGFCFKVTSSSYCTSVSCIVLFREPFRRFFLQLILYVGLVWKIEIWSLC